jgi:hypothetical protein
MLLQKLANRITWAPHYWRSDVMLARYVFVHVAVVVSIIEFLPASGALTALQCLTLHLLLAWLPERSLPVTRGKGSLLTATWPVIYILFYEKWNISIIPPSLRYNYVNNNDKYVRISWQLTS